MSQVPRKRFGQHFLVDNSVIDAIVRAIDPMPGDHIVEIGPGRGALTGPLHASGARLTLIELDRDLAAHWQRVPGLELVQADVLRVDFASLAAGRRFRVAGNLPYNISTPILFHLLEAVPYVIDQHVMLQKEVVDRIAAAPGGREYGRLSVMLQWCYEIERLFDVPAASFDPPPRVTSGVLRMVPRADPPVVDAALLSQIVTVAFSQRRKLLRHTLGRWLEQTGRSAAFDLRRRAEEVAVDEYVALAQTVAAPPSAKQPAR
ncbi:MAG: 16S rRNA (adenine(1518)-N(6)/adenine(1519)-N(6))-dimethyltransferase RsmA [Burkholderiaceae bacterium]|nr:MAG: 16S rRNA (adenine(1518)-N(6)/adenine(1519)-N(6))-dimethyltransferase RsmA [Burkholderiaceae bacterium]MCC7287631.1 16S rRNA (adenine(1518)-N(6)/adenine(1519)-N(6))-dimethyltransferase RsmA [Burkholderiaceae bacterium]